MYFEIEDQLIEKAAAGDMYCFEEIVALCEKSVYNICYRYFDNTEDAKDNSQESFIKIFRGLKNYNYKSKFSTWVYKVTVNCCIDNLRKKRNLPATEEINDLNYGDASISQNPEAIVISKESLKNVENAISRLSVDHKTAIILRDVIGLSYQDISMITNVSVGTIKSRLSRARNLLKVMITDDSENLRCSQIDQERSV